MNSEGIFRRLKRELNTYHFFKSFPLSKFGDHHCRKYYGLDMMKITDRATTIMAKNESCCRLMNSLKIIVILSLVLLVYSMWILNISPENGYESSIYTFTPIVFWIAITINIGIGVYLVFLKIYKKTNFSFALGMFLVLISDSLVLLLSAIRGYFLYFGRADVGSYIGMAKDISIFGHVLNYNFYPIVSILISELGQLTGVSIIDISKYIIVLFFLLYVFYIFCWSKSLNISENFVFACTISGSGLFFSQFLIGIYHQAVSFLMLPLLFYCLTKRSDWRYRILSLIILLMLPFMHPITAIWVLIFLVIWISVDYFKRSHEKTIDKEILVFYFVATLFWFTNQYILLGGLSRILSSLMRDMKAQTVLGVAAISSAKLGLFDLFRSILLQMFDEITFYILVIISFIYYIIYDRTYMNNKLFVIYIEFVLGNIFLLMLIALTNVHTPSRMLNLNFNMIFATILVGYFIHKIFLTNNIFKITLIICLIFLSIASSVMTLYPSPFTMEPNQQISYMDICGSNWAICNKNMDWKTLAISTSLGRFAAILYGNQFSISRPDLDAYRAPDHFDNLSHDKNTYLIVSNFDIFIYADLWNIVNRINKSDFKNLNSIINVNKIYLNGEYFVYLNEA